jgi:poly-beta-1,6-N-acetyl-D-glucosamine N-deacetylase
MKWLPWVWCEWFATTESKPRLISLTVLFALAAVPLGFSAKLSFTTLVPNSWAQANSSAQFSPISEPKITEPKITEPKITEPKIIQSASSKIMPAETTARPASGKLCPVLNQSPPQSLDRLMADTSLAVFNNLGATVAASLTGQPYPNIHPMARLARVPVVMYHDILPEKQVFFDVTPAEFEAHLKRIQQKGLTPISLDQLVTHLRTGTPLPAKPILLSFDDGYAGHYTYVYPLLKRYGYPGVFGIYTSKVGKKLGRSSLTWAQIKEMAADPLVTIASHSISHPENLTTLTDQQLQTEVIESKRILEQELKIPVNHFVYPVGHYDERVQEFVKQAGYHSALTMNDAANYFAGASDNLLSIERIGQGNLDAMIDQAYGGPALPLADDVLQLNAPIELHKTTVHQVPLILATGGRPVTLHANRRYQVGDIIASTNAEAAVDGGFFSLESLNSNVMVGPVFSQATGQFVPGNIKEIRRIAGRPLVLIGPTQVKFVPFDPEKHNTLAGMRAELPALTDAFVGAAWLVKESQPRSAETFGTLFDFDAARDRAFWGIDQAGRPVVGVSGDYVDSVTLGNALSQAGLREAVMLDSGASASLVFQGQSQMSYEPRPVPHVVALVPATGLQSQAACKK